MTPSNPVSSNSPLDHSSGVGRVADNAAQALGDAGQRAGHFASDLAERGADALRDGSHQLQQRTARLQDRAQRGAESTVTYIKEEPLKAMLIAAASGAVLMGLIGLISRSGHHRN